MPSCLDVNKILGENAVSCMQNRIPLFAEGKKKYLTKVDSVAKKELTGSTMNSVRVVIMIIKVLDIFNEANSIFYFFIVFYGP